MITTATSQDTTAFSASENFQTCAENSGEGLVSQREKTADWLRDCDAKIHKLRELEPNWNSYGANPVNPDSINLARAISFELSKIPDILSPRIGASPAGNVIFSWEWDEFSRELEMEIDPRGIRYSYIDDNQPRQDCEGETVYLNKIVRILT